MGRIWTRCGSGVGLIIFISGANAPADVTSVETLNPPRIDGIAAAGEWDDASTMNLTNGVFMVLNDGDFLYLLIDLTSDTANDTPGVTGQGYDYFNLSFDVNRDGAITDSIDVNYTLATGTQNLNRAFYQAPNTWQPGSSPPSSELGVGFGPTLNSSAAHRFWELAVARAEIDGATADEFLAGLGVFSAQPAFYEEVPIGFTASFSNLWRIALSIDCNGNGITDADELEANPGLDADGNGVLDACEGDADPTPPTSGVTPGGCAPIGPTLPMMILGAVGFRIRQRRA